MDTYHGVVYLTGGVESARLKREAETIAREVPHVEMVVNNLHVLDPEAVAASASTARAAPAHHPLLSQLGGVRRLGMESGTPAWTRYAAHDAAGRRVATVYAVTDGAAQGVADLGVGGPAIDHVALYPPAAGGPAWVVLWHVAASEAARLR